MHILLIHQSFATLDEAGGTRHFELAQHLLLRGHTVTVIASPISYLTGKTRAGKMARVQRESPQPGMTILRPYTYPALHKSFFHRLINFFSFMVSSFLTGLSVHNVDVVWGTSPPIFQGLTAWLLARLKGTRFLFEVRDLWPAFAIAVGVLKNRVLITAMLWLEKFLYSHADRVMVNSPGFIQHVTQRGARWVELVPNGADPDMFSPLDKGLEFRQKHGLQDAFIVLYAGAHGFSNDLDVVLNAASLLCEHPHIQFVFVGDGKDKPRLQSNAAQLGLKNVHFLPAVPKTEMQEVLAASNACLAILKPIELYKTTYPNKVFDYMAAGRPVLLAIDGVIRKVVESAQAGLFIQPGSPQAMAEAVLTLAQDPEQAVRMGISGSDFIKRNFNRTRLAEQLALLLEDMVISKQKKVGNG